MQVKVSLYGKLGDLLGRQVGFDWSSTESTVAELRKELAARFPAAASDLLSPRVRACVNDAIVQDHATIGLGDDIALLPPVSGG